MFYLIEEREGETTIVYEHKSLRRVIDAALDEAESNGYVPATESREDLEVRLLHTDDRTYTDGDVVVKIIEKI